MVVLDSCGILRQIISARNEKMKNIKKYLRWLVAAFLILMLILGAILCFVMDRFFTTPFHRERTITVNNAPESYVFAIITYDPQRARSREIEGNSSLSTEWGDPKKINDYLRL